MGRTSEIVPAARIALGRADVLTWRIVPAARRDRDPDWGSISPAAVGQVLATSRGRLRSPVVQAGSDPELVIDRQLAVGQAAAIARLVDVLGMEIGPGGPAVLSGLRDPAVVIGRS